jgi:hypothetical protein
MCVFGDTVPMQKGENIRVQVTFTKEQLELINKSRGLLGNTNAEIVRNIVVAWLAEKSIVSTTIKEERGLKK